MQILLKIHDFLTFMLFERWYYYLAIFIFLVIFSVLSKLFFNKILGILAERTVAKYLSKLGTKKYKTINNLMLKSKGNTAQIEHLVISNYGIFIIESKNYFGWITGNDYSDYWLQSIYKFKQKIINPIKQNYGHMKTIKNLLLDYPNLPYYPIVVFTRRSVLKVNTMPDVVYNIDLIKTIKKYRYEFISDDVRDKVFNKLKDLNIRDKQLRKEHNNKIRTRINDYETKIKNNICPKCSGNLVLRNGIYGKFMGCSNYPKCKFTINSNKGKYIK